MTAQVQRKATLSNALTDDEVICEQQILEAEARGNELLDQRLKERVERACEWELVRRE